MHKWSLTRPREKHGMCGTPTYCSWVCMKMRCTNPNTKHYERYGARGINICDRWIDSFSNFLADMGERPDGATLDRIDVDGHYEPGNCRWATVKEQARNKNDTLKALVDGVEMSVREVAEKYGINKHTLLRRIQRNPDLKNEIVAFSIANPNKPQPRVFKHPKYRHAESFHG